jgi:hypothetical protein
MSMEKMVRGKWKFKDYMINHASLMGGMDASRAGSLTIEQ